MKSTHVLIAMLLVCGSLTVALFVLSLMWQSGSKELARPIYLLFGINTVLLVLALIIDELRGVK